MDSPVPGYIELDLLVEQIYYRLAVVSVSQAEGLASRIACREGDLSWLSFAEAWDLGDENDPDEEDLRHFEAAEESLRRQFGLLLQALVMTHVLSAMCLEAYINAVASEHLSGRLFDAFDRLSQSDKWLLLPHVLSSQSFDPGSEPFQGFQLLLRRRNRLVHAKNNDLAELLLPTGRVEDLIEGGVEDAHRSIKTIDAMTRRLAELISIASPAWLELEGVEPFHVRYST